MWASKNALKSFIALIAFILVCIHKTSVMPVALLEACSWMIVGSMAKCWFKLKFKQVKMQILHRRYIDVSR